MCKCWGPVVLCETEEGLQWPLASPAGMGKHSREGGPESMLMTSTGDNELGKEFQVEEMKSNKKPQTVEKPLIIWETMAELGDSVGFMLGDQEQMIRCSGAAAVSLLALCSMLEGQRGLIFCTLSHCAQGEGIRNTCAASITHMWAFLHLHTHALSHS